MTVKLKRSMWDNCDEYIVWELADQRECIFRFDGYDELAVVVPKGLCNHSVSFQSAGIPVFYIEARDIAIVVPINGVMRS